MQGNNPPPPGYPPPPQQPGGYGPPPGGYGTPPPGYPPAGYPPPQAYYPQQANFGSNEEGRNALLMAIGGFFCFGIILGPLAYRKAMGLPGGMAAAARIIAVIDIILWTIGIIFRFMNLAGGGHHY
jgi:hypothetical protein